jgi:tight adherence protein C
MSVMVIEAALIALGFIILIAGVIVGTDWSKSDQIKERIDYALGRKIQRVVESDKRSATVGVRPVKAIGTWIANSGIFNAQNLETMRDSLRAAGIRDNMAFTLLIGAKLIGCLGLPIIFVGLGFGLGQHSLTLVGVGFASFTVGLLAPEWSLKFIKMRYQRKLRDAMPDALDLMMISVDSGMALGSAISRVAIDTAEDYPELSAEFQMMAHDMQVNPNIEQALRAFATRTGIEETGRFAVTLIQSSTYGTPLTISLNTLSSEMRTKSLADFEERAMKLSTKMTVPMIFFILPALLLVIVGPSIGPVLTALKGLHHH